MRKTNVRKLRAELLNELNDLPFQITRNGKVVAEVVVPKNMGLRLSAEDVTVRAEEATAARRKVAPDVPISSDFQGGYPKGKQVGKDK